MAFAFFCCDPIKCYLSPKIILCSIDTPILFYIFIFIYLALLAINAFFYVILKKKCRSSFYFLSNVRCFSRIKDFRENCFKIKIVVLLLARGLCCD